MRSIMSANFSESQSIEEMTDKLPVHRRGDVSLADVLSGFDSHLEVAKRVARSIGLEYKPPSVGQSLTDHGGSLQLQPVPLELPTETVSESATDGYPAEVTPLSLWLPVSYEKREPLDEDDDSLEKPKSEEITWDHTPPGPQSYRPLNTWARLGPRLLSALLGTIESRRVDVNRLVDRVSRAESISPIPLQLRQDARPIHCLRDRSKRLTPFFDDQKWLVEQLNCEPPTQNLTTQDVKANSSGGIRLPSPPSEATLLVLSDLGTLASSNRQRDDWLRWGKRATAKGCRIVALAPCAETLIPDSFRRDFDCVSWQPDPHAFVSGMQRQELLKQLFALASVCRFVQPGLLRELRLLLPGATDASLESDFWMSPRIANRHLCQASLSADTVEEFRPLVDSEAYEHLWTVLIERIRQWRYWFPEVWFFELLSLPKPLRKLIPETELDNAREFVRRAEYQRRKGAETEKAKHHCFLHRGHRHLTDEANNDRLVGKLLAESRAQVRPDLEPSAGADARFYPAGSQPVGFSIQAYTNKVRIASPKSGNQLSAASVQSTNRVVETATFEDNPQTEQTFWKDGRKPDFVSDFGRDKYGAWFEFTVSKAKDAGKVTQRMRWIPAGEFLMGSPHDEPDRYHDEGPQHKVKLTKGFWLAATPCTQDLWSVVNGKNPSDFTGDQLPVEGVSWEDVRGFNKQLSEAIPRLFPGLPTEAQWDMPVGLAVQLRIVSGAS